MRVLREHRHDGWQTSFGDRVRWRLQALRAHPWLVAIGVAVVVFAVAAALAGPKIRSASINGWQSVEMVGVNGEPTGTCAAARGPTSNRPDGDQWIICGQAGTYRCYLQPVLTPLTFNARPIRRTRFDRDCRSALTVLEKAGILH